MTTDTSGETVPVTARADSPGSDAYRARLIDSIVRSGVRREAAEQTADGIIATWLAEATDGRANDDLTPEDERWCEDFFRNLFPEDDDDSGGDVPTTL